MNGLQDKVKRIWDGKNILCKFTKNSHEVHASLAEEHFLPALTLLEREGFELISLFAVEEFENKKCPTLLYVLEKKKYAPLLVIERSIHKKSSNSIHRNYSSSIASLFPSACWYEREITDGFSIEFEDSLDNRNLFLHEVFPENFHPLLNSFKNKKIIPRKNIPSEIEYKFKPVDGEGVYQIPVGPVHAGIIEPGHFRFNVIGETIVNLEIRMFYKHRGVEKVAEGKKPQDVIPIAEAISGDETVANAVAFCMAVEKISEITVPKRAVHLRMIFLELERMYALMGDLAGMIIDVAYPVGASPFFILREELMRQNQQLTGSRFMKNTICIAGVKNDVIKSSFDNLKQYLTTFMTRLQDIVEYILTRPSVIDRFETTGIIKKELVKSLHLTGPAARASGVIVDTRIDHPYALYDTFIPTIKVKEKGDVLARFEIKVKEIINSAHLCHTLIQELPKGTVVGKKRIKEGYAITLVESPRGQNMHFVYLQKGKVVRYKVRTASFCNWQAIEHAVLGNIVPDFPLINKSLNLSYAGTDL